MTFRKDGVKRAANGKSLGYSGVHPESKSKREAILRSSGISPAVAQKEALNALAGSTLGILALRGADSSAGISESQRAAGESFTLTHRRHAQLMGFRRATVASPNLVGVIGGQAEESFPGELDEVRGRMTRYMLALQQAGQTHGRGTVEAVWAVCIDQCPIEQLTAESIGALRIGLNSIGRVM